MRLFTLVVFSYAAALGQTAGEADRLPKVFTEPGVVREGVNILWHDPGDVANLDFRYGIGGPEMQPKPPFTFVSGDTSGTTPKVQVRDAEGRTWVVKFGQEASPDTFCTRLAWALGYYVEPEYYVADGVIEGAQKMERASNVIDHHGRFRNGRFQLRSKEPKFLKYVSWSWSENPFVGTPELNGLKILMMLVSNWDDKDVRDAERRGTNTAVYQQDGNFIFFIDDWGGALGNWGGYFSRSKWNARDFRDQSADFVSFRGGSLHWGYGGQHTNLLTRDLKPGDVGWLLQYLGQISDDQLRTGLLASGATPEETSLYLEGLRMRIDQLKKVTQ